MRNVCWTQHKNILGLCKGIFYFNIKKPLNLLCSLFMYLEMRPWLLSQQYVYLLQICIYIIKHPYFVLFIIVSIVRYTFKIFYGIVLRKLYQISKELLNQHMINYLFASNVIQMARFSVLYNSLTTLRCFLRTRNGFSYSLKLYFKFSIYETHESQSL